MTVGSFTIKKPNNYGLSVTHWSKFVTLHLELMTSLYQWGNSQRDVKTTGKTCHFSDLSG